MSYKARPYSKWSTEAQVGASNYLGIMKAYLSKNRSFDDAAVMLNDLKQPMPVKKIGKQLTKMYTEVSGNKKSKELTDAITHASNFVSSVYTKLINTQGEDKVLTDGKTSMSDTFNWVMRLKGVHDTVMYPGTDNMNNVEIDMNNQYRQLDLDSRHIEDVSWEHVIHPEKETTKEEPKVEPKAKTLEPVHNEQPQTTKSVETIKPAQPAVTETKETVVTNDKPKKKVETLQPIKSNHVEATKKPETVKPVEQTAKAPVNNFAQPATKAEPKTIQPVQSTQSQLKMQTIQSNQATQSQPKPKVQTLESNNANTAKVAPKTLEPVHNEQPKAKTTNPAPKTLESNNATPKPAATKTAQSAKKDVNYLTRSNADKPKLHHDSMAGLGVGLYATNVRPIVYTDANNFVHSGVAMEVKKRDDLLDQKTKYDGHYVSNREGDKAPHFQGLTIASANAYFKATNQPTRTGAQIAEDFENKVAYNSGAFVGNVSKPSNAKGKDDYIFNANPKAIKPAPDFATAKEPEDYKVREAREAQAVQQAKEAATSNQIDISEADLPF